MDMSKLTGHPKHMDDAAKRIGGMEDIGKKLAEQQEALMKSILPPRTYGFPEIKLPTIPTIEERNEFQSAGNLVTHLAAQIRIWQTQLPEDHQAVVWAVLPNGLSIDVRELSSYGHNLVKLTGLIGDSETVLLAHQATVQILCFIKREDEPERRYKIGFGAADDE